MVGFEVEQESRVEHRRTGWTTLTGAVIHGDSWNVKKPAARVDGAMEVTQTESRDVGYQRLLS